MKKSIIISSTIILLIALIITGFVLFVGENKGFDIKIKNNTNENILGLKITYHGISKDMDLPEIKAGETYEVNVNPQEKFSENQMVIYYKDNRGVTQKNVLIGYFENGYRGRVNVNINSRDNNGLIIMQTQEKIGIFN